MTEDTHIYDAASRGSFRSLIVLVSAVKRFPGRGPLSPRFRGRRWRDALAARLPVHRAFSARAGVAQKRGNPVTATGKLH